MRVRITQPGWETYTGQMGVVDFVDGLSVGDVDRMNALRFSAVMSCEGENGETLSLTQEILDKGDSPAPVVTPLMTGEEEEAAAQVKAATDAKLAILQAAVVAMQSAAAIATRGAADVPHVEVKVATESSVATLTVEAPKPLELTQAQLEAVADADGIRGLREVTDRFDIKGNSIAGLIADMVKAGHATKTLA